MTKVTKVTKPVEDAGEETPGWSVGTLVGQSTRLVQGSLGSRREKHTASPERASQTDSSDVLVTLENLLQHAVHDGPECIIVCDMLQLILNAEEKGRLTLLFSWQGGQLPRKL